MKKWIILTAAITFAVGLVVGSAYVALAQGNTPPTPFGGLGGWMGRGMMGNYAQAYTGTVPFGRGGMMHGWGYSQPESGAVPFGRGAMMAPDGVHEQVMTAVAKELGLTYDELQTALQTKTLAQIAEDEGVELEKLQQVAQDAWKAAIEKLVTEGKLTREQADWMLQRMDAAGFPMFGQGRGFGPCHDDDDGNWGPLGQDSQEFGFRGGRGGRPGMMGRSTW
jgi:Protein of unknown function (DUF2680)